LLQFWDSASGARSGPTRVLIQIKAADVDPSEKSLMPIYRVHFVDHGGNVYSTEHVEHDSDDEAVKAAHRLNVPSIGAGFDLWEDERLVHQHRN